MDMATRIPDRSMGLLWIVAVLLGVAGGAPAKAQELAAGSPSRSPARFVHWMYQDAIAMVRATETRTSLYVVGTGVVLSGLAPFDTPIYEEASALRSDPFDGYLDVANALGGPRMKYPVIGLAAISLVTDDERFQDAAFTSLQSLIYAGGLFSHALKYAVGRHRPAARDGAFHFSPFSGRSSFPSGHATTAFAVLTPWVLYYPSPVTYGLFAVAVGTGVARIARDKHWATDVVAGAALGSLTAYWLTRRHQQEGSASRYRFSAAPTLDAGVAFHFRVVLSSTNAL